MPPSRPQPPPCGPVTQRSSLMPWRPISRNQAEAERASAQLRRAGRMPTTQNTTQNTTRSAARDVAKRERQRLERVRDDDARER